MICFRIAEVTYFQNLELCKKKLDKSQDMNIKYENIINQYCIKILLLFSSTSGVKGKFFNTKISFARLHFALIYFFSILTGPEYDRLYYIVFPPGFYFLSSRPGN
jgi:hypothetical protein